MMEICAVSSGRAAGRGGALARRRLIDWHRRNRARSNALFDLVGHEACYARPIALRLPLVFYEGDNDALLALTVADVE